MVGNFSVGIRESSLASQLLILIDKKEAKEENVIDVDYDTQQILKQKKTNECKKI